VWACVTMSLILSRLPKSRVRQALEVAESSVPAPWTASGGRSWYDLGMRSLAALALAAVAAVAVIAIAGAAAPTKIVGNPKNGKKLFVAHDCGSCHIMAAANQFDGSGAGPDLDTTKKTYPQIVANITNGGKGMTGYKHALTTSQIDDLAAFIYTTAHTKP